MNKGDIKDREYMYRLITGQLFYDGHQQIAFSLAQLLGITTQVPPPSDKLFRLVNLAKQFSDDRESMDDSVQPLEPSVGLDMEYDSEILPTTPEPSQYETIYITSHKAPCRAAVFSPDGHLVATGSADCSIKILDVDKIISRDGRDGPADGGPDGLNPVIRTLYDHMDEVTAVAFHPRDALLLSGSNDCTLKLFDYSKNAVKRAIKTINEVARINAVSFHPSGEYFLAAADHEVVRLYNTDSTQCFVCSSPADHHIAPVFDVKYSDDARMFVSGGSDGDVKVWDGISNRCIQTFTRAHDGAAICSVQFTKNGKYVLSSGFDSTIKLWELSTNRCLIAYTGAGSTGHQTLKIQAGFNHNEDFVMFPDEKSGSLCSWDSRTSDRKRLGALGHTAPCRVFVHSPTMPAFVTGSDDYRARFWYKNPSPS
ncbi:hypothetical protein QR680_011881 [Steinernema hermaphroditum]|uniref:Cleavage stimulation factor 50 kDa subunit n=1 Tax=Steinernema hermaphroditum TaxID=289476 RepID=A0AA39I1V8_9BILA|nr:hypothetical protein QR680_011881 [Steinernema hermaphroditum]